LKFRLLTLLAVTAVLACAGAPAALADDKNKTIHGYVERVIITNKGFSVKARLDTGAATSSLDSVNIRRFRRGDVRYVRFDVLDPDSEEFVTLERELVRDVLIRQAGAPSERRPVVKMTLCIGEIMREVEVNLTSRSGFLYPMLIGRSAMRGLIIVDPELTFTQNPSCDPAEFGE
jgi:hypothetical protein